MITLEKPLNPKHKNKLPRSAQNTHSDCEQTVKNVFSKINMTLVLYQVKLEMKQLERLNHWVEETHPMLVRTDRGDIELPCDTLSWFAIDLRDEGISTCDGDWYTAIYAKPKDAKTYQWFLVDSIDFVNA